MRIAILETGAPPGALAETFGGYGDMLRTMLAAHAPSFSFSLHRIEAGETAPPISAFDGLMISGSPAGVYDGHPWIASAERLIEETATAAKPQIGVCFGHQLMAQAFGGEATLSDSGWGVGVHAYDVHETTPWMTSPPRKIACVVSHQDQVTLPPPGATVLAGSAFCPNGFLSYAHAPAISVQMHPEFETEFARNLLDARRNRIPDAVYDDAKTSFLKPSDRNTLASWFVEFYRRNA